MKKIEPKFFTHDELNSIMKIYQTFEEKLEQRSALSACIVEEFDFSGIDLSSIFAIGSIFIRCKFIDCELYGAIVDESQFINADFRGANLGKANFYTCS